MSLHRRLRRRLKKSKGSPTRGPHLHILLDYITRFTKVLNGNEQDEILKLVLNLCPNSQRGSFIENLTKLAANEVKDKKQNKKAIEELVSVRRFYNDDWDDIANGLERGLIAYWPDVYKKAIGLGIELAIKHAPKTSPIHKDFRKRVNKLSGSFLLTNLEMELVLLFFLRESYSQVNDLMESGSLQMDNISKSLQSYAAFLGTSLLEARNLFQSKSKILLSGLIRKNGAQDFEATPILIDYLSGITSDNYLEEFFPKYLSIPKLNSNEFTIPLINIDMIKQLLKSPNPVNILFYGGPGVGKTELAHALAHELKNDLFVLRQTDNDGEEDLSHRKTSLVAAQNILKQENSILLVDECDEILSSRRFVFFEEGSRNDTKSWINNYLDTSKLKIIWITNKTQGIDESTRRRFSFSQKFSNLSEKQRIRAWELQRESIKTNFLDDASIRSLSEEFIVSPGVIAKALQDIKCSTENFSKSDKIKYLKKILEVQQEFIVGKKPRLAKITPAYSLDLVNTDVPLQRIVDQSNAYLKGQQDGGGVLSNFNVLLYGPPGTGKTEFVKHFSKSLDRDLLVKRASDLISPWVGGTEQNISEAFQDAQNSGSILFLDEADSFFINREGAQRSWEVSQTNELLCQMENFSGILVCATNFIKSLDTAVLRRFQFKVKFDYLNSAANIQLFQLYFGKILGRDMSAEERKAIAQLSYLTPGDFKVAYQQAVLSQDPNFSALYSVLAAELRNKKDRIQRPLGLQANIPVAANTFIQKGLDLT